MPIGEHKLAIAAPPLEVIYHPSKESQRWQQNWIATTDTTARGVSVVKGVSARLPIYRWQIKTKIPYWKALRLDRLNANSQQLLGEGEPEGIITLSDKVWLVDSNSRSGLNRSVIETFDFDDGAETESGSYCTFQVELILPNSFSSLIQGSVFSNEDLTKIVEVSFELKEF
ncbi:MAG: hypothetical protein DDT31_00219 [Syntrophomonadaceae bacterium]|nr:hypothetical protein [Bacillota bacterium]